VRLGQRPSSDRGITPTSSPLYWISPKGSYQLVYLHVKPIRCIYMCIMVIGPEFTWPTYTT